ncbi:MAG: hypothetical protein LBQ64_04840 [Bacteroidales bacterium]|jgi:hypothetical protein|nr:hypothetical protein [Bacteroidales bacterium]
MKKIFVFLLGIALLSSSMLRAQITIVGSENFDGISHSFTSVPVAGWVQTTDYVGSGKSLTAFVPMFSGDSVMLTSPVYNLAQYDVHADQILMRFNHICKVSPQDIVRIEYRISGQTWRDITDDLFYYGSADNYQTKGFNAESYTLWKGKDSTAMPSNGWWQEELFDVSSFAGGQIEFRFILKHGTTIGSQLSYGWLIDDFRIEVSKKQTDPPSVRIMGAYPVNTVYKTGPFLINLEIKTDTAINSLQKPVWLKYTSVSNSVVLSDSVAMTNIEGVEARGCEGSSLFLLFL